MAKWYRKANAYWEKEQPTETTTGKIKLRYFPKAGKLQVAAYFSKDGQEILTKVVTLDQEDMVLHPEALKMLIRVLSEWCKEA